jgi:hypothetical protein
MEAVSAQILLLSNKSLFSCFQNVTDTGDGGGTMYLQYEAIMKTRLMSAEHIQRYFRGHRGAFFLAVPSPPSPPFSVLYLSIFLSLFVCVCTCV